VILLNVKEKIIEVSKLLDELDKFEEEIPLTEQSFDFKLSDLYHKLENMSLDSKRCYRFCKELKSVLKDRREWKTNRSVYAKYQMQKSKMINGKENRNLLLNQICREDRIIRNSIYKNRVYTEEELLERIGE